MGTRDEFTDAQIRWALETNAADVASRWPDDFRNQPPHYICEECGFVSPHRRDFEIDHVLPCAQGGTRDRHPLEIRQRLYEGDTALLYETGMNIRVLCRGCNQGKKAEAFVPGRCGYAFTRHSEDCNPDHKYSGIPGR